MSNFDLVKLETDFGAFLPFENQGFGITRMNWKNSSYTGGQKAERLTVLLYQNIDPILCRFKVCSTEKLK